MEDKTKMNGMLEVFNTSLCPGQGAGRLTQGDRSTEIQMCLCTQVLTSGIQPWRWKAPSF